MDRVSSLEEYTSIVQKIKKSQPDNISNIYLYKDAIQDCIEKNMIFYSASEDGAQFFINEGAWIEHYYIVSPSANLQFDKIDKPFISYLIRKDKNAAFSMNEKVLTDNGFEHSATMKGYDIDAEAIYAITSPMAEVMSRSLLSSGFSMRIPCEDDYIRLWEFIEKIDEIPFWDKTFPSREEFKSDIANGFVKCIYDKNDEIVAAGYAFMEGIYEYGWIAVKKEYRGLGAMAVILTNEKVKRMKKNGSKGRAWVSVTNDISLKYHEKCGYTPNGRFREIYFRNS